MATQGIEKTLYACCDDPSPVTGDRPPHCAACDTTLTPEQAAALDCEHPEVAVISPRITDGPGWASYREGRLRCTACGMAFCQAVITSGGTHEPASPDPCPELATGVEGGWELCDHHRQEQAAPLERDSGYLDDKPEDVRMFEAQEADRLDDELAERLEGLT
jgi:hypothetical protein